MKASRKGLCIATTLFLSTATAWPCANGYEPFGVISRIADFFISPSSKAAAPAKPATPSPPAKKLTEWVNHPPKFDWASREATLRERVAKPGADYKVKSDYAVTLLHLKRTDEAIAILEPLAMAHPDEYRIIASLGTDYELTGRLERSLAFIKKAMQLNPASHEGTEWLHVKILEAKLALEKDPEFLKKQSVLGYKISTDSKWDLPPEMMNNSAEISRVSLAILYQLHERLQFVRAPDPTVADLLFAMANIYSAQGDRVSAGALYASARKFGKV